MGLGPRAGVYSHLHRFRICGYALAFFATGYALALPGAALGYLSRTARASEAALGTIFVVRGACYAAASLGGGALGGLGLGVVGGCGGGVTYSQLKL